MKYLLAIVACVAACSSGAIAGTVSGTVTSTPEAGAISGARVTLFTTNLKFFREVRSDASGTFQFKNVPNGSYRIVLAQLVASIGNLRLRSRV